MSQTRHDFLERHRNADEIVVMAGSGELVKAVYSWDRLNGRPRQHVAEYYFPEF